MKQTAVEWFEDQVGHNSIMGLKEFNDIFEQAKEMEREQIIEAQIELIKSIVNQGHNNPLYGILKKTLIELHKQYNEIRARYV
jgi:hypothetical protein